MGAAQPGHGSLAMQGLQLRASWPFWAGLPRGGVALTRHAAYASVFRGLHALHLVSVRVRGRRAPLSRACSCLCLRLSKVPRSARRLTCGCFGFRFPVLAHGAIAKCCGAMDGQAPCCVVSWCVVLGVCLNLAGAVSLPCRARQPGVRAHRLRPVGPLRAETAAAAAASKLAITR